MNKLIQVPQIKSVYFEQARQLREGALWLDIANEALKLQETAKQAQPEPVDPHAADRIKYAKQVKDGTVGFYLWEYKFSLSQQWMALDHDAFFADHQYRCTDISCYVSKDGEPAKRMTRLAAKMLWDELGYTVEWYSGVRQTRFPADQILNFDDTKDGRHDGEPVIYTYASKALKQVSWSQIPMRVAVRDKTTGVIWLYQGSENGHAVLTNHPSNEFGSRWINLCELEIAPASEQPWIAVQDRDSFVMDDGLIYLWRSNHSYKITGIAKGYKMAGAV